MSNQSSRTRTPLSSAETGDTALEAATLPAGTDEGTTGTEAPAPALEPENPADSHVPLSEGKGGCYVIGDDGRRVRVTTE